MSSVGHGAFHVYYTDVHGNEQRTAYPSWKEAEKARDFLEALGIYPEIDFNTKKKDWEPNGAS